jgi:hypothetical protein
MRRSNLEASHQGRRTRRALAACTWAIALAPIVGCGGASSTHAGQGSSRQDADGGDMLFGNAPVVDSGSHPVVHHDASIADAQASSCGESTIAASPRKVNVLLVIDKSGSMTDTPAGFATNKWDAIKSALGTALGDVQREIGFGLVLYPFAKAGNSPVTMGCSNNCCETPDAPSVGVAIGTSSMPAILDALADTAPSGGTPTAAALKVALDYYQSGAGKALEGDRFVLLATDGGPDCNTDLSCDADHCTTNLDGDCPTAAGNCCDPMFGGSEAKGRCLDDGGTRVQIDALAAAGVKTLVVGIPGSEAYAASLETFATAGKAPNPAAPPSYFAVSAAGGVAGLSSVLGSVTKGLVTSCRMQLMSNPPDPQKLNVSVDGTLVPQADADGWVLDTTASPPTVVLNGAVCSEVESKGANTVSVVYGCPTVHLH